MATVPELKAQAQDLGIKVLSSWRKADIESAIKEAQQKAQTEIVEQIETVNPRDKQLLARIASRNAKVTSPMEHSKRLDGYRKQAGRITDRQYRRVNKKMRHALQK